MRQKMENMSAPPDRDVFIINEVIAVPKNDQPVDLRVSSAIQRENINNHHYQQEDIDRPGKNMILASLLTRASSPSTQIKYSASPHSYSIPKSSQNFNKNPLSLKKSYLRRIPENYDIPEEQFQDSKRTIMDRLKIHYEISNSFSGHKSWNVATSQGHNERNSINNSNIFHNNSAPATNIRNIPNDIEIRVDSDFSTSQKNYPYFKNLFTSSDKYALSHENGENAIQESRNTNSDSCSTIRERLNSNTVIPLKQYSGHCPTSHLYRLLKQGTTGDSTQSLKRKLLSSVETNPNDASKNKTLKCLLSAGKRLSPMNTNHFQNSLFHPQNQKNYSTIKTEIKTEPFFDDENEIEITYQGPRPSAHTRHHQKMDTPSHIVYCPQVIRAAPVLKGLLVSNYKDTPSTPRPTNILPTSRPSNILAVPNQSTILATGSQRVMMVSKPSNTMPVSRSPTIFPATRPINILPAPRSPSIFPTVGPNNISPSSRPPNILPATVSTNILPASRPSNILPSTGPTNILSASGPPSSGSPGSESSSSGSTDSGVFSDALTDDRRRVTRVLSGRHVKTGTGASITTLRLLRQMIIDRKNKTDRKLL
ncbi:uncharacterized protein CDAR_591821 [Caerostris darwini]|uniref:Uncharacterized protein n=1 Tax=Caerostris darwini TaxID=1538125 RepID=A0AAV4PH68_9ARAC|nr:uncharacterized protein CDAR_591821 [Caerostris darwini]